jgi:hypothetical protein
MDGIIAAAISAGGGIVVALINVWRRGRGEDSQ